MTSLCQLFLNVLAKHIPGKRRPSNTIWADFGNWTHPQYHKTTQQTSMEYTLEQMKPSWNKVMIKGKCITKGYDYFLLFYTGT